MVSSDGFTQKYCYHHSLFTSKTDVTAGESKPQHQPKLIPKMFKK